jgi:hypothetical protein
MSPPRSLPRPAEPTTLVPDRPVPPPVEEEDLVTTAMHPHPATTDAPLAADLARLVDAVLAPAAPVPAPAAVAVLARAAAALGGRELRAATRSAAERLERALPADDPLPPGLDGPSGAVWALVEAARVLDDKPAGWRAMAVASRIATRGPDLGAVAGTGLAQLRLWLAFRDRVAASRVRECTTALVRAADHAGGRIGWPGSTDLPGIGRFLLAASRETGPLAGLRMADRVAATLHADVTAADDPVAVGSFLVRHAAATGDRHSHALAGSLAAAGPDTAATGELLVDLAALDPGRDHRARAEALAARLDPADPAALSLRLRLRHGGSRPWTTGDLEAGPLRFRP